MPLVLNSSCWLEFFADTDRAGLCAEVIEHAQNLEVPVLTVYEVAKTLVCEAGDDVAAGALSLMQRDKVINNDLPMALEAAVIGLPLADSLIHATARRYGPDL